MGHNLWKHDLCNLVKHHLPWMWYSLSKVHFPLLFTHSNAFFRYYRRRNQKPLDILEEERKGWKKGILKDLAPSMASCTYFPYFKVNTLPFLVFFYKLWIVFEKKEFGKYFQRYNYIFPLRCDLPVSVNSVLNVDPPKVSPLMNHQCWGRGL